MEKRSLSKPREQLKKVLKKWGGKLVEQNILRIFLQVSLKKKFKKGISTSNRISSLKRLLHSKDIVRIIESHNSLTGLIIENVNIKNKGELNEFDGMVF